MERPWPPFSSHPPSGYQAYNADAHSRPLHPPPVAPGLTPNQPFLNASPQATPVPFLPPALHYQPQPPNASFRFTGQQSQAIPHQERAPSGVVTQSMDPWLQDFVNSLSRKAHEDRDKLTDMTVLRERWMKLSKEASWLRALLEEAEALRKPNDEGAKPFSPQSNALSLTVKAAEEAGAKLKETLSTLEEFRNNGEMYVVTAKRQKTLRNRRWRKKKRIKVASALCAERAKFEEADQAADDWRAQVIARDLAQQRMESMRKVAAAAAAKERGTVAAEVESLLIIERLQTLRALRLQRLKKAGHLVPTEDDDFLTRVAASVQEEEEAQKNTEEAAPVPATSVPADVTGAKSTELQNPEGNGTPGVQGEELKGTQGVPEGPATYFQNFYNGPSVDMGMLIQVRRAWDQFLSPHGSRIPGHWVIPPPPANAIWESYLVKPPPEQEANAE